MATINYPNPAIRKTYSMVTSKQCGAKYSQNDIFIGGLLYDCNNCKQQTKFSLHVFSNDKSSFLFYTLGTPIATLQKIVNGAWVNIVGSLGTVYPAGFLPNDAFYQGVVIDWNTVFANNSKGTYKLFIQIGAKVYESYEYILKEYSCLSANRTCYLQTTYNEGFLGDPNNQLNQINFKGSNWIEYHRIPAMVLSQNTEHTTTSYFVGLKEVVSNEIVHQIALNKTFSVSVFNIPADYAIYLQTICKFDVLLTEDNVTSFSNSFQSFNCFCKSASFDLPEEFLKKGYTLGTLKMEFVPKHKNIMNLNI